MSEMADVLLPYELYIFLTVWTRQKWWTTHPLLRGRGFTNACSRESDNMSGLNAIDPACNCVPLRDIAELDMKSLRGSFLTWIDWGQRTRIHSFQGRHVFRQRRDKAAVSVGIASRTDWIANGTLYNTQQGMKSWVFNNPRRIRRKLRTASFDDNPWMRRIL